MNTGALFTPAAMGFTLRPRAALRLERTATAARPPASVC